MTKLRKSFSAKLCITLLLLGVPIFLTALGLLFAKSHTMIRNEAMGRANSILAATVQNLEHHLMTIETATHAYEWMVKRHMNTDTLLAITNRVVMLNPTVDGCSISAEPFEYNEFGKYMSVYTIRENDTVQSIYEEDYDYHKKKWYDMPKMTGPCWVAYSDEADTLGLALDGMIASYGVPLYDNDSTMWGILSSDLSLLRLSMMMQKEKPYPNSYVMMLDEDGRYFVHPNTSLLFHHTIFENTDKEQHADIIALAYNMTQGKEGNMNVTIDGQRCLVCYRPVPGTPWSLAIVCPDNDILAGYHQLTAIVLTLTIIGLIFILILSYKTAAAAMKPLHALLEKTQSIADGNMEVFVSKSQSTDVIGQLQNSVATMVQSMNIHMGIEQYTIEQTYQRNEELTKAIEQALEAERQKTIFIQNVTHQIRTPLNIIVGFIQVLSDTTINTTDSPLNDDLSDEDTKSIIDTMFHNAVMLYRMVLMLYDSSDTGMTQEQMTTAHHETVNCYTLAQETIKYIVRSFPEVHIDVEMNVPQNMSIRTNQLYLMRTLREIIYNSAKYSDGQHIKLIIDKTDTTVTFTVEDTGKGISEETREQLFNFFTKVDVLSEGLGLGLPLSKRHAQNLGGDLTLDTTYTEGCRFVIEVPIGGE